MAHYKLSHSLIMLACQTILWQCLTQTAQMRTIFYCDLQEKWRVHNEVGFKEEQFINNLWQCFCSWSTNTNMLICWDLYDSLVFKNVSLMESLISCSSHENSLIPFNQPCYGIWLQLKLNQWPLHCKLLYEMNLHFDIQGFNDYFAFDW